MTCADGFQYTVAHHDQRARRHDGAAVQQRHHAARDRRRSRRRGHASRCSSPSPGRSALSIQFPSTATCSDPITRSTVTVNCPNTPPTCNISQPTISGDAHRAERRAGPRGRSRQPDRFALPGDVRRSRPTPRTASRSRCPSTTRRRPASSTTLNGTVANGSATFGVPLSPDGTYQVSRDLQEHERTSPAARRRAASRSTRPPPEPVGDVANGRTVLRSDAARSARAFNVCARTTSPTRPACPRRWARGSTTSASRWAAPPAAPARPRSRRSTPTRASPITCPGGAPFDLTVTLKDGAGNPTDDHHPGRVLRVDAAVGAGRHAGLRRAGVQRSVEAHPVRDRAGRHPRPGLRTTPDAQADVVACTDRSGTATLVGRPQRRDAARDRLDPSRPSPPSPADNCPSGLGFVARFTGVTLPNSIENTERHARDADRAARARRRRGQPDQRRLEHPRRRLGRHASRPSLTLQTPANLCGSFHQSSATFDAGRRRSPPRPAASSLQVTNGATTDTYTNPTFASGVATFAAVDFDPGPERRDRDRDRSGGQRDDVRDRALQRDHRLRARSSPSPRRPRARSCARSDRPTAGCIQDNDTSTAGWQGTLTVHVTGDGQPITSGNVTFTIGAARR